MANKLRDFVSSIISKNLELTPEQEKDFLDKIPEDLETPENFQDEFHKEYLTVSSARNNTDIRDYYYSRSMSTVDSKMKAIFKAAGYEEKYTELEQEKDTIKRIETAFEYVKTLQLPAEGGGETSDEDRQKWETEKGEFAKKIDDLNSEIVSTKEAHGKALGEINSKWENQTLGYAINDVLGKKEFAENHDPEDVRMLVHNKLNALGYIFKRNEDGKFEAFEKDNPEIRVHKENVPWAFDSIVESVSEKYVKKSDPNPNPNSNPKPIDGIPDPSKNGGGNSNHVMGMGNSFN